jgi:sirohydrochlorin ferrochelatase
MGECAALKRQLTVYFVVDGAGKHFSMTTRPNSSPLDSVPADEPAAWLLIGHGTRSSRGLAEFRQTVELVAEKATGRILRHAFLELAEPTIESALAELYDAHVRGIFVVPLMLFAAGHVKRDIPLAIAQAADKRPGLKWHLAGHLGCHERIVDLSKQRFEAARNELGGCDALILVARGSRDDSAIAEMAQFARLHAARSGPRAVEVAFAAMAAPRIGDVLARVGEAPGERIVVQPHLLFHGEILDQIRQSVRDACRKYPNKRFSCAEHLGPSPELAETVLDLARNAPSGYDQ